jgi:hypothetical protein
MIEIKFACMVVALVVCLFIALASDENKRIKNYWYQHSKKLRDYTKKH